MEKPAEKKPGQIASGDRGLAALLRMGRVYDELDRRLQPSLPEGSRGHIRVACVEGDCLVLAAESSAWASRARLEAETLLQAARTCWPDNLRRTRIIVCAKAT
jgi:hypothetical protein